MAMKKALAEKISRRRCSMLPEALTTLGKKQIGAMGPVGLLIEAVIRTGGNINGELVVFHPGEVESDLRHPPFQHLKELVIEMGRWPGQAECNLRRMK